MGFRSDPNHCPRCRERVSAFAAGCGLCGADLDPRRHARRRPLWLRALTGALVSCIAVALIVAAGLANKSPSRSSDRPRRGRAASRLGRPHRLDDELERRAVGVLRLVRDALGRAPSAFGWMLCALDLQFSPPREIAILGPPESEVARAALATFDPNAVVAFGPADGVPLLEGKTLVDGRPAVYVCERFACQAPVTEPKELVTKT
jgi:hypothetical protein